MADNYLERRMEELRSGKLTMRRSIPGIKPGSKRVVIVGGTSGEARDAVSAYRREGCRVAVFDSNEKEGKRMAYENGIRFHNVDIKDTKAVEKETERLLKIWSNIDVIAGDFVLCEIINRKVREWKSSLPIADKTAAEIVII